MPGDFFAQLAVLGAHWREIDPLAPLLGGACMAVVLLWPKNLGARPLVGVRRWMALLPGTVIALAGATLLVYSLKLPLETIGSRFGGIPQALPAFALPEFSWQTAKLLLIPTVTIALLGAIESLLCARVADTMAGHLPRHDPNQELMAQGVANIIVPFFGGIPATGTIARTVTNVRAGATSPVAGIVHALTLLAIVLVAAPLATHVPLAALAGILLVVAWHMGEWHEFARLRRFSLQYRTKVLGTFGLTVVFDLTVAVEAGLLLACIFFVQRMGQLFRVAPLPAAMLPPGLAAFELYGALFFGAVGKLDALPSLLPPHTRAVVLQMHRLVSIDTTGLEALRQLHLALQRQQIVLLLAEVNEQPLALLRRSGFAAELGEANILATLAAAASL
jgi:SulP family sulfate permease